jgi:hypothetical protein
MQSWVSDVVAGGPDLGSKLEIAATRPVIAVTTAANAVKKPGNVKNQLFESASLFTMFAFQAWRRLPGIR